MIVAGKAVCTGGHGFMTRTPAGSAVMGAYFTVLFAFALLGVRAVWLCARRGVSLGVLAYPPPCAVFLTTLRYRVPLEPFLCILARRAPPHTSCAAGRVRRKAVASRVRPGSGR